MNNGKPNCKSWTGQGRERNSCVYPSGFCHNRRARYACKSGQFWNIIFGYSGLCHSERSGWNRRRHPPPTDTAQAGDVVTWDGENVVWGAQAGGEKPWRLINTVSLTEPVRAISVSQDSGGTPFEVNELLIRGWLTCAESSRQNANVGVNGFYSNLAGNLPLIKNAGYFGPCEIHIYNDCGYFRADIFYTDSATNNDPPALYQYVQSMRAVDLPTFPCIPYTKISNFSIQCTSTDVEFSEKCMLQIYGR